MMKRINAYQTSDGKIHETELLAIDHEFRLTLRGIFNRNERSTSNAITIDTACLAISKNLPEFYAVLRKHNEQLRYATQRAEKQQKSKV